MAHYYKVRAEFPTGPETTTEPFYILEYQLSPRRFITFTRHQDRAGLFFADQIKLFFDTFIGNEPSADEVFTVFQMIPASAKGPTLWVPVNLNQILS